MQEILGQIIRENLQLSGTVVSFNGFHISLLLMLTIFKTEVTLSSSTTGISHSKGTCSCTHMLKPTC